jgi:hypothetical protein
VIVLTLRFVVVEVLILWVGSGKPIARKAPQESTPVGLGNMPATNQLERLTPPSLHTHLFLIQGQLSNAVDENKSGRDIVCTAMGTIPAS